VTGYRVKNSVSYLPRQYFRLYHDAFLPYFLGVSRPEHEADHSSPSIADVKNAWKYTFTPQHIQTISVAHPYPYLVSTMDSFGRGKTPGK
jgi:hypothetical protein